MSTTFLTPCALVFVTAIPLAAQQLQFTASETAGIRRRHDVVTASLKINEAKKSFRLFSGEKMIPAQYRVVNSRLFVDFIDHFAPFEKRKYRIKLVDEPALPEVAPGLTLRETDTAFHINSARVVDWQIRKDMKGLLGFAWKDDQYLDRNSVGLYFIDRSQKKVSIPADAVQSTIQRSGPIATTLQYRIKGWPQESDSTVTMDFVRTKSWVRIVWEWNGNAPITVGAELDLKIEDRECLIDFGGGDFVYTTARAGNASRLTAGPRNGSGVPWQVDKGTQRKMTPLVVAARAHPTPRVFGWAHAMDSKRCTAIAASDFGETTRDALTITGEGKMDLRRAFERGGKQRLEFWYHFVVMPVHIGARTSPRSMQEPLKVEYGN